MTDQAATTRSNPQDASRRLLITAGPTHEPIDAVRYIGNRSTGRLGVELADRAAGRGWRVTLLLGPTPLTPSDTGVRVERFRTTADLEGLLSEHLGHCDVLVMAAAVADYRPRRAAGADAQKIRRTGERLVLELDPTPDLVAACVRRKRPDQRIVGFALEPRDRLMESAASKLERKGLDMIVANPLETMESGSIEATLVAADGSSRVTPGVITKSEFADWLLDALESAPGVTIGRSGHAQHA